LEKIARGEEKGVKSRKYKRFAKELMHIFSMLS